MLCNLPSPEQQQTDRSQEMFDSWRLTPSKLNNCFRMMIFQPSDEITKSLSTEITTACYFTTLHLEPSKILADAAVLALGQWQVLVGKVCMNRDFTENNVLSTQQKHR
jgi:hypothetical protein